MAVRTAAASPVSSNHIRHFDASVESVDERLLHQQEADFEEAKHVGSDAAEIVVSFVTRQRSRRFRSSSKRPTSFPTKLKQEHF
jgi:hypothetical protein